MNDKDVLIKTDLAFSYTSKEQGVNAAFIEYIADDGVILRPDKMPFVGKNVISELFTSDDSGFTLTWKPLFAEIAISGELGYTYGTYEFTVGENIQRGTYLSIWKKDRTGKWKLVLDSGNDGLGDAN